MEVVEYKAEMYPVLAEWWNAHKDWAAIPEVFLPKRGWVVQDEESLLCAGFLYVDQDAPFGVMEWIVANPDNAPRESIKALHMLIASIVEIASKQGLVLHTSVRQEGLAKLYAKHGFSIADSGMINMIRGL